MKYLGLLLVVCYVGGCCWAAKRDCFPPCPPREVVTVEKLCELPGDLKLDEFKRTEEGCPTNFVCYDIPNAAIIAKRESDMKTWIKTAKARCGQTPTTNGSK